MDGRQYEVGYKDGMYIGMGSAPAHREYPTKLIKLEGGLDSDDVVAIKAENKVELGCLEESNHRVINKYILPGQVEMLTRNICSGYGQYNIQCNGIGPGYIETPQTAPLRELQQDGSRHPFDQFICAKTPANRWLKSEELQGPAVFLAFDASDAVNGHILYVDGGIPAYIGRQPGGE